MANSPTADYSVGTTWGYDGHCWLLLDLQRGRLAYPELLAKVRFERKRWRTDVIIVEQAATGIMLLHELTRDARCLSEPEHHAPLCARVGFRPKVGKEERLSTQVERLYSGHARLPIDAPWLPELKREMIVFPHAKYDDQVDSVTQFLEWSKGPGGRRAADPRARFDDVRPRR